MNRQCRGAAAEGEEEAVAPRQVLDVVAQIVNE
jgi:hypothetical protein